MVHKGQEETNSAEDAEAGGGVGAVGVGRSSGPPAEGHWRRVGTAVRVKACSNWSKPLRLTGMACKEPQGRTPGRSRAGTTRSSTVPRHRIGPKHTDFFVTFSRVHFREFLGVLVWGMHVPSRLPCVLADTEKGASDLQLEGGGGNAGTPDLIPRAVRRK
jgi:hypothetical protein